jgi:leader peptidase (prepilin peptidase)/N-methyltransferase
MSIETLEILSEIGIYIFVFLCGATIGSFLNVCILRLPRGESLVKRNSHCMTCGAEIKRYDLIPIVSWLILGGKCRNCKAPISPRYMLVELLTAVLFVAVYVSHDIINYGFFYPAILCLFVAALIVLCFEDFDTKTMSLSVLLFAGVFAAAAALYSMFARNGDYIISVTGVTLHSRIIGLFAVSVPLLLIGFVITPAVYKGFISEDHAERRKLRKRIKSGLSRVDEKKVTAALESVDARIKEHGEVYGFGMGDVVLMAAAGLMLGVKAVVVAAFIAIVLGAVYGIIVKSKENADSSDVAEISDTPVSVAVPAVPIKNNTVSASNPVAPTDSSVSTDNAPALAQDNALAAPDNAPAAPDDTALAVPDNTPGFAFGPFLCMGSVIGIFVGNKIADWYLGMMV